jgi:6-phosphogluconolactonase (cycloisomerase 2 family)
MRLQPLTRIVCLATLVALRGTGVHAACNIIPVAGQTFPSINGVGQRSGSVSAPIAAPGETVRIKVNPTCDGLPPGFVFLNTDVVKLTFLSPAPSHPQTVVDGENETVDLVEDPTGGTLRFTIPYTDTPANPWSPDGLAGPARITVERGAQILATIGPLYQSSSGCDLGEENVFKHFTVLPKPNDVATQSTAPTRILLTVDGNNNILIPFDHRGGTGPDRVLPEGPGAPVARLLRGNSSFPATTGGPTPTLSQALATAIAIPLATSEELLRSFTIDGKALPPFLRIDTDGALYGTTDADRSVLRLVRLDKNGAPIYDVTTRLSNDVGPIVINPAFTLTQCEPVRLRGLRTATGIAAFTRDEFLETPTVNLNSASGDGDKTDRVVQLINTAHGGQGCASNTGLAVSDIDVPGFSGPVLETSGALAAFTISEAAQNNSDIDGNGVFGDGNILQVYKASPSGTLTEITPTNVSIDLAQRVNNRTLIISDPLVFARTQPGALDFRGTRPTAAAGSFSLAISPDGKHLYDVLTATTGIEVYARNATTGALTFVESQMAHAGVARAVAVSPDGAFVYVVGQDANEIIRVFRRNAVTGALTAPTPVTVAPPPAGEALAVFPDGSEVLVADFANDRIQRFKRAPVTGDLSISTAYVNGVNGVDGLDGVTSVAISPDGRSVYATGFNEDAIAVFHNETGSLVSFVEAKFNGLDGVSGLSGPTEVRVSPDGLNVYVTATFVDDTVVFRRNPATGKLTFLQSVPNAGGEHLAVGPDGRNVYVARGFVTPQSLGVFRRGGASGALGFVEELKDGVAGVDGLAGVSSVAVSPDGLYLYGAGFSDNAIAIFGVSQGKLSVFDTTTQTFRGEAAVEATEVAVSGLRAGILSPEANLGGDRNGDSDGDDLIGQAYDGTLPVAADRLRSLGVAANRIVISPDVVAVTVPEAHQNLPGLAGTILNNDGDTLDDVVFRQPLPVPSPAAPQPLGVAADALGVSGATLVIVTPESAEGPNCIGHLPTSPANGCDLDGDGDAVDRVLRLHRPAGFTEIARPVEEFVIGGDLVAFRSSEAAMNATGAGCRPTSPPGGCDRNGDGDTQDAEMLVYDLANDVLIDTGQSAIPCSQTIPGCEAQTPYKIKGNNVCFLTSETEQNNPPKDLDGDGNPNGIVLQCFNVRSRRTQTYPICDNPEVVEVFPGTFVEEPLFNVRVLESAIGRDVNGDGFLDDCVFLVEGDSDHDDTFDHHDTCIEDPNAKQSDSDLDGLGDTCDPTAFCGTFMPDPPLLAQAAAAACQKTIGKAAAGYLKQRIGAERACLDAVASGKLTGDATALCRGTFVDGAEVPPQDLKAAAKIAKAAAKFAASVAKQCSDSEVAQLDACAGSNATLPGCVIPTYGAGAVTAAALAYGDVASIGNKTILGCQRAVGAESRSYLEKIAKALTACLDKINAGKLVGDAQVLCLGSVTPAGVVPPAEPTTQKKVQKADSGLRAKLAKSCPGTELQSLDVCNGAGTTVTATGNCLACTHWRYIVEAVRSAYGPNP